MCCTCGGGALNTELVTSVVDGPRTLDKLGVGELFYEINGGSAEEKFYGEQGHDKIWLGYGTTGNAWAHGGTGDDTIYGGYGIAGNQYIYGNAGRDTLRTDWWETNGAGTEVAAGNEYIFGDYKYGADNLDKDLWGDADIIYGGNGAYNGDTLNQKIYGGDGDDIIHQGEDWIFGAVYG